MNRRTSIGLAAAGALCLITAGCSDSGSDSSDGPWEPDDTVELMVTGSPGGGSDTMARVFEGEATSFRDDLTVAVENYDPIEAYTLLKGQAGDPNRIMTTNYGGAVLIPTTQGLDYSWEDYSPVAVVGIDYAYVVVSADSPYEEMADLVDAAAGGGVTVGQVTGGGQNSVLTSQLEDAVSVEFEPVVFEGGGEQVAATLAGDVDFSIMEPAEFVGQAESGDLRVLMVLGDEPAETGVLASSPTPADAGIEADFVSQWRGFFAAADLTDAQLAWWVETVEQWTESEAYQEFIDSNYIVPELIVGDELEEFLAQSVADSEEFAG